MKIAIIAFAIMTTNWSYILAQNPKLSILIQLENKIKYDNYTFYSYKIRNDSKDTLYMSLPAHYKAFLPSLQDSVYLYKLLRCGNCSCTEVIHVLGYLGYSLKSNGIDYYDTTITLPKQLVEVVCPKSSTIFNFALYENKEKWWKVEKNKRKRKLLIVFYFGLLREVFTDSNLFLLHRVERSVINEF